MKKRWNGASGGYILAPGTPPDRKGFLVIDSIVNGDVPDGSFQLGRNWHGGGDASLRPQATVRNTHPPSAIKTTPWSDMFFLPAEAHPADRRELSGFSTN